MNLAPISHFVVDCSAESQTSAYVSQRPASAMPNRLNSAKGRAAPHKQSFFASNPASGQVRTGRSQTAAKRGLFCLAVGLSLLSAALSAQAGDKVDFERDVQPLLRQNCFSCHGPKKQKAGMRLDRRSSALKKFARRVVPGSSENSMVYHRLIGEDFGPQMPPPGALRPEQIAIIKAWIDQGAEWPDSLANEMELPPLDPKAVALVDSLHNGDLSSFMRAVQAQPALLNARGPEGSTPFMYAVLYLDTANLAKLLELGAYPNKHNDDNATALMWAARDFAKTRLLVAHGADVNAESDDHRTPLMIAARRPGAVKIVKFLLDKGANPNPTTVPVAESSPLLEALTGGDEESVKMLIQRGADAKATADQGLVMAAFTKCAGGLELLAQRITDKNAYTAALPQIAFLGDTKALRLMLDHGADVNAFDPTGRTPLMYAAISDLLPVQTVKLLIERGADINAIDQHKKSGDSGYTALDIAKQNGNTPIVELLLKSGARARPATALALKPRRNNSIRYAVQDCLPLLQHAGANFAKNTSCISCHNNSMEEMAIGLARTRGFRIDEAIASAQVRFNSEALEAFRDKMHQGFMVQEGEYFTDFVLGYQLVGLHSQNYQPDLNTDAAALLIQSRQKGNGEWTYPQADSRPPICLSYVAQTALAMRALQLYAPKTAKGPCEKSIRLAASWLAHVHSHDSADRTWQLIGLAWAGMDQAATKKALREVLATQRPDGGWADLPSMQSTPYATGINLVAMHLAGLPVSSSAYQRGVDFLVATQQEDGSWFNKTRALGFQPYFDGSFPHSFDQWISSAGTSWAAMALTLALPETEPLTASTRR